jgi:hypothetical protein
VKGGRMIVDQKQRENGKPSGNACPILASPFDCTTDFVCSRFQLFPDSRHHLDSRFVPAIGIVVRS